MKIKEYGLYNVYVDGEIMLHEIFGYEVKEEVAFLKKMYAEGCGRPRLEKQVKQENVLVKKLNYFFMSETFETPIYKKKISIYD